MSFIGPLADRATRLGPAIVSFPIVGAALLDPDTLAVVSRNLRPARLALLDPLTGAARRVLDVPTGDGAWAITADGSGGAWLGMFGARGQPNLYRYDRELDALEIAASIDAVHLWDLAVAADGLVYGVSDGPAAVFAFDPVSWLARDLGVVETGPEAARSVAVAGAYVVIGGRRDRAFLRALPLAGGPVRDLLPPVLSEHAIVYALAADGPTLALGTRGPGRRGPAIAVLDVTAPPAEDGPEAAAPRVIMVPDADVIEGLTLDASGVVWATARPTGAVLRVDVDATEAVEVARPVPLVEQRTITRDGAGLVGASGDGSIWRVEADGAVVVRDLLADGILEGGPEIVQSLAAADGAVWAGGTFGVARRLDDAPLERWAVPGEPKAMVVVDGTLHLALYPIAELWVVPPDDRPRRLVSLPPVENRPLALHHHPERDVLLVGTAADAGGGGGFHAVDATSGAVRHSRRDPLGDGQAVARVASVGDLALLGGRDGTVVALHLDDVLGPEAGEGPAWRVDLPVLGGGPVSGLAALEGAVHVLTSGGWHLVLDAANGAELQRAAIGPTGGGLVAAGGRVFGVDADRLLALHADGSPAEVLLDGLAPRHWGPPSLAADGADLLVLAGTDVLRVRLPS